MRWRVWWSLILVAVVLVTTAVPSSARTSLPSPAFRLAAGCNAPPAVRQQNLQTADYLLDGSGASGATSFVAGRIAVQQTAAAAVKRQAGALAAAELAEGGAALYEGMAVMTGWGFVILFVGYAYYKYTKDDPPDPHFRAIASPLVRSVALAPVPGLTAAETAVLNALAANTQQLLAVTKALATTQNRATGAAAAGQDDWVQRQTDVAKQYALRLAGLLDAQPALRAALRQALAADPRFPASIQPGPSEVRDFQSDMAAHGLPTMLAQIAQRMGLDATDLAQLRASITSADPTAVAGLSFPGVLTDPQITAFDTRGAASWRQFAAGSCPAPVTATGTFKLVPGLTKVSNTSPKELTIDATGGSGRGIEKHCCEGDGWDVTFTFQVPQTLTPGTNAQVTVGIQISNVRPEQPLGMQINVLAPDFAQALNIQYPHPSSGSKTFQIPISTSYSGFKELWIQFGFYAGSVTYTYRP